MRRSRTSHNTTTHSTTRKNNTRHNKTRRNNNQHTSPPPPPKGANVVADPDLASAVKGADILVLCAPHQFVRAICKQLAGRVAPGAIAVSLTKGMRVREDGPQLVSQMVAKYLGVDCSVLMGANIARDIGAEQVCGLGRCGIGCGWWVAVLYRCVFVALLFGVFVLWCLLRAARLASPPRAATNTQQPTKHPNQFKTSNQAPQSKFNPKFKFKNSSPRPSSATPTPTTRAACSASSRRPTSGSL